MKLPIMKWKYVKDSPPPPTKKGGGNQFLHRLTPILIDKKRCFKNIQATFIFKKQLKKINAIINHLLKRYLHKATTCPQNLNNATSKSSTTNTVNSSIVHNIDQFIICLKKCHETENKFVQAFD